MCRLSALMVRYLRCSIEWRLRSSYLLWLLPFLTSASTLLLIVSIVIIILTYVQWHLRALGRPWGPLTGWVMLVEYGCVATAAAMIAVSRLMRPASPR